MSDDLFRKYILDREKVDIKKLIPIPFECKIPDDSETGKELTRYAFESLFNKRGNSA